MTNFSPRAGPRAGARARATASVLSAVVLLSGVATAPAQAAQPARTDGLTRTGQPAPTNQILVRYSAGTTAAEARAIARGYGFTTIRSGRTSVVVAQGRSLAAVRRALADDPSVEAIAPNHRRALADDISAEPGFRDLWALDNTGQQVDGLTTQSGTSDIDIDGLQALALGLGRSDVVVAVIDDGVDFSHVDLADRAWTNPGEAGDKAANGIDDDGNGHIDDVHGWDFCNDDATVHDPGEGSHGTHVAGTIAASLNGQGVVGVAPGVSIMALKFIDDVDPSCGNDDMAVAAIDYAASFGVRIINASWGGPEASAVLDQAIVDSGALFVAAAGNTDNGGLDLDRAGGPRFYPASSTVPTVLSVAAVDQNGRRAGFSNYGATSIDIAAPGTNILSTFPASGDCPAPCYAFEEGTSMAAPHVTGVAALAASARAGLLTDPVRLRARILATGQELRDGAGWTVTGRIVNAFRAVDAAPPKVFAPGGFAVKVGGIVKSSGVSTVVSWPAATDAATWIASYGLTRKGPDGWKTLSEAATGTQLTSRLKVGAGYRFRLTAKDAPGNISRPVDGPSVVVKLHQDGASLARYRGAWRTIASSGALDGRVHSSSTNGASVTATFTGRSIGVMAAKGPGRGAVKVFVDGILVSTVDLQRATSQARVVVAGASWAGIGQHRIRIVIVGSKRVDIDGFVVIR